MPKLYIVQTKWWAGLTAAPWEPGEPGEFARPGDVESSEVEVSQLLFDFIQTCGEVSLNPVVMRRSKDVRVADLIVSTLSKITSDLSQRYYRDEFYYWRNSKAESPKLERKTKFVSSGASLREQADRLAKLTTFYGQIDVIADELEPVLGTAKLLLP